MTRTTRLSTRLALVAVTSVMLAGLTAWAATPADASVSTTVSFGVHGAAKLTRGGPNTIYVNLKGLANGTWAEAIYSGTCARLGARLIALPALTVANGVVRRTNSLTSSGARLAAGGVIRIARGTTRLCASFAPASVPTPTPTPTPTPSPSPSPSASGFAQQFFQGQGSGVVRVKIPHNAALATFRYSGTGNFIVYVRHPDLTKDLLVNTIGKYAGTTVFFNALQLEISASGLWQLDIDPVSAAVGWGWTHGGKISGSSDTVARLEPPLEEDQSARVAIGAGLVAIWAYTDDGYGHLVFNEIGPCGQFALLPATTWIVEIQADTAWSMYVSNLGSGGLPC